MEVFLMDSKIRVSKNYQIGSEWKQMELTDENEAEVQKQLAETNNKIMEECIADAEHMVAGKEHLGSAVAVALFDKRAVNGYTLTLAKIEQKIKADRIANANQNSE